MRSSWVKLISVLSLTLLAWAEVDKIKTTVVKIKKKITLHLQRIHIEDMVPLLPIDIMKHNPDKESLLH